MCYNHVIGSDIMSKVHIKAVLKGEDNHIFNGPGIKTKNQITYNDNGIMTKITFGEKLFIERKSDYILKLGFIDNEYTKGTYITKEGKFILNIKTNHLNITKDSINIKYEFIIDKNTISYFEFNLHYTIDK